MQLIDIAYPSVHANLFYKEFGNYASGSDFNIVEYKFKINDNANDYIHLKACKGYIKKMHGKNIEAIYGGGTVAIGYKFNSNDTVIDSKGFNIYINGINSYDNIDDMKVTEVVVTSKYLTEARINEYYSFCSKHSYTPLSISSNYYCEYNNTTVYAVYFNENNNSSLLNKEFSWLNYLSEQYTNDYRQYFKSEVYDYNGAFPKCYIDYDLNIIIPDGTKKIPDYFMYGLPIKSLQLPESLEYIGERAFAGSPCGYYLSDDIFDTAYYTKTARNECTELHIPENVKHIGDGAFAFWYKLRKIIIDCDVFWDDDNTKYYNLGNLIFYAGKSTEHNHYFNRDDFGVDGGLTDDSKIISDYIDTYNEHTIINTYRDVTSYILNSQLHVLKTEVVCKNENIYNYMFSKDNRIISNKDYMYIVNGDFLYSHVLKDKGNIEIIIDDNCKKYLSVSELKDTDYNKLVINIDGKYYAVDR